MSKLDTAAASVASRFKETKSAAKGEEKETITERRTTTKTLRSISSTFEADPDVLVVDLVDSPQASLRQPTPKSCRRYNTGIGVTWELKMVGGSVARHVEFNTLLRC